MKTRFKGEILGKHVIDSGAIAVLDSVIHRFDKEGDYRVLVLSSERVVAVTEIYCRAAAAAPQVDIDLSRVASSARGLVHGDDGTRYSLQADGYAAFYVSSGSGRYRIRVLDGTEKPCWDSERLVDGDVFATTLLLPGTYAIENRAGRARGTVRVEDVDASRIDVLRERPAVMVTVAPHELKPESIELVQAQGLCLRVEGEARVVITPARPPRELRSRA